MERKSAQPTLAELARRQWGVVTRAQLTELGVRDRGIADWVRSGRLHRLYRGIYAVGHDRLRLEGRWLAAVLACGPGAVLSHRDAGVLWDLRQSNSAYIDVTVPSRNGRKRQAGIRVHRSGRLRRDEVTVRNGIPVTTVARTLLDLADVLDRQALKRVITEAEYLNLFDLAALNAVVQSESGPPRRQADGGGRRALAIGHDRSWSERFLALLERHRVEEPESGVWIEGYETDFLWRSAGLVVELDGLAAHRTRRQDRWGIGAVTADSVAGRAFARCGSRRGLDEPEAVLDDLAHAGVSVPSRSRASSKPPRRSRISPASVR